MAFIVQCIHNRGIPWWIIAVGWHYQMSMVTFLNHWVLLEKNSLSKICT